MWNIFFGSSKFGFFTLLATFIEEIRTMKYLIDDYYDKAEKRNFTYNESLFNDPNGFYEEFYNQYENNIDEYGRYNPGNILRYNSHKRLLITYLFNKWIIESIRTSVFKI